MINVQDLVSRLNSTSWYEWQGCSLDNGTYKIWHDFVSYIVEETNTEEGRWFGVYESTDYMVSYRAEPCIETSGYKNPEYDEYTNSKKIDLNQIADALHELYE